MRWLISRARQIYEVPATVMSSPALAQPSWRSPARHSSTTSANLLASHDAHVARISRTISAFHAKNQKYRISHGSTNSTRTHAKGTHFVDLSALNRVLDVDVASRTALVEPNVPMDRLVEATLPHGLVPPVVMEFPGITAGGGYAGTSGESSSFRHGFFDATLEWAELVLADGAVVRCSATERADLFRGAAGAVGSLGTTTLVKIRLEPATPFVEVVYRPVRDAEHAVAVIRQLIADGDEDFIDGILFGATTGAVITGRKVAAPTTPHVQRFSGPWDPWFYMHVRDVLARSPAAPTTETVPLAEYLFRYDRGGFWVGRMAFSYFRVPFSRLTRWLLDDFLHTRMLYTALHHAGGTGRGRDMVIQDLALPLDTAAAFVRHADEAFGIWPLWLCPLKTRPGPAFHPWLKGHRAGQDGGVMLNVGLWGWAPSRPHVRGSAREKCIALNAELERVLARLGGMKWLYAKSYYAEADFWADHVGGRGWYDALRERYGAGGLPSAWDKTCTEPGRELRERTLGQRVRDTWPLGGLWGLWKAIGSGTYKAARASRWRTFGADGKKEA